MSDILKQAGQEVTPVTVSIGGTDYRLSFPMIAVIALDKQFGFNLYRDDWNKLEPKSDPTLATALIYVSMITEQPQVTFEEVGKMIHFGNIKEVSAKVAEALSAYLPKPKAEIPNEQPAAAAQK